MAGERAKYLVWTQKKCLKCLQDSNQVSLQVRLDRFQLGRGVPIFFQDFQLQQRSAVQCGAEGWAVRFHRVPGEVCWFLVLLSFTSPVIPVEWWLLLFVPFNGVKQLSFRLAPAGQHKEGLKSGLNLGFATHFWSAGFVLLHLCKLFGTFQCLDMTQRGS